MRPSDKTFMACVSAFAAVFLALVPQVSGAETAGGRPSDLAVWRGYTLDQKTTALIGFADCYTALTSKKSPLTGTDIKAIAHYADRAVKVGRAPLQDLLMKALKDAAPVTAPDDPYAETLTDGEWWRDMGDAERWTFAQGVSWCELELHGGLLNPRDDAIRSTVKSLDEFYAVDADWKDPRATAHIRASFTSALKRSGTLKAAEGRGPALRLSRH